MAASHVMGTNSTTSDTRRTVFLHTGWRTAGTWLWARFRALPWVEAYHEPLHEILDTLTTATVLRARTDTWTSGHPALARPYYHEYAPLLRTTGGVEGFHASFATEDFFADANATLPTLRAYLTRLLDHASARGRYPVMKFCRSIGRVGWMQSVFPHAVHIVVLRNPATQFASARRHLARQGNPYFLVMPLVILLRNRRDDRVADALRLFDVRLPPMPDNATLDATLRACLAWIDKTPAERWYRGFMAFWLLGVSSLPETIGGFIDADLLILSSRYRATTRADLVSLTRLPVTVDDVTTTITLGHGLGVAPPVAWHCHQLAALLLAARLGADWATTSNGAAVAAMLAHADLVAASDDDPAGAREVDRQTYLQRLQDRAVIAQEALAAVHAAHDWRPITPMEWVQARLTEAA